MKEEEVELPMTCPHCGQPVTITGQVTRYYVPKRPAHKHEPACTVCGSLDETVLRSEEEETRV